ncbi:hypothetical protein [Paenibacillus xanthanilyticus]|uniref:Uncharacterized protein n=1 Tax=Paenibacillus xanthanilyticus TaxID=1783531 RepID=A0ABV8K2C6_9BACL
MVNIAHGTTRGAARKRNGRRETRTESGIRDDRFPSVRASRKQNLNAESSQSAPASGKANAKRGDQTAKSVTRLAASLLPWYKKLASDKAYAWSIYLAAMKGDADELRDLVTPEVKHDGVLSFTATPGRIIVSLRLRGAMFSNRFDVK